jgi:phytoene synthase
MEYVYGSASVIGLQMLPILGAHSPEAKVAAEKLGTAFQLANFIRDVGEDLERGRIYLPIAELQAHGVTHEALHERILTPAIREALKEQIARVRQLQREAAPGIALLAPESRACIEAASELYCGIVDEVEKIDYQIFDRRAKTSTWRRIRVALPAFFRAVSARRK